MKTSRALLTLTFCLGLAAPVLAQTAAPAPAPAPAAPAPAAAPAAPPAAVPAPAAPAADPAAVPVGPVAAPETAPIPEPVPEPQPAPVAAPVPEPAPAPAPVVAAPPPPPPGYDSSDQFDEENRKPGCVRRGICIGPVVTLGIINPIGFGAHARIAEDWGAGIDYQFFPSVTINDTGASWSLFTVDGRWYPGGGSFFLSLGFGYQSFSSSMTTTTPEGKIGLKGSIGMPAIKLGLGVMGGDGFVMGIDLGMYIPLGGDSVDFDKPTGIDDLDPTTVAAVMDMQKQIEDAADKVVTVIPVVPQLNLFRIGYLF